MAYRMHKGMIFLWRTQRGIKKGTAIYVTKDFAILECEYFGHKIFEYVGPDSWMGKVENNIVQCLGYKETPWIQFQEQIKLSEVIM